MLIELISSKGSEENIYSKLVVMICYPGSFWARRCIISMSISVFPWTSPLHLWVFTLSPLTEHIELGVHPTNDICNYLLPNRGTFWGTEGFNFNVYLKGHILPITCITGKTDSKSIWGDSNSMLFSLLECKNENPGMKVKTTKWGKKTRSRFPP